MRRRRNKSLEFTPFGAVDEINFGRGFLERGNHVPVEA